MADLCGEDWAVVEQDLQLPQNLTERQNVKVANTGDLVLVILQSEYSTMKSDIG